MTCKTTFKQTIALGLLSCVFFIWGFLTSLNSVLVPYLQQHFQLSYSASMLIQLAFYLAPFVACLPTAMLIRSIGYRKTLVAGLVLIVTGCLFTYPATEAFSYTMILLAIFITAMGVASLQVVATPYVTLIGDAKGAPARLSLTSAINSLGTTIAPFAGVVLLFSTTDGTSHEYIQRIQVPYFVCALIVLMVATLIFRLNLPEVTQAEEDERHEGISIWQHRHLLLGILTIFCYVGVEVSIGTFMMSYLTQLKGVSMARAGQLVAMYWGGAMAGRFIGSIVFRYVQARLVLIANAVLAVALLLLTLTTEGPTGIIALVAMGLCNSIMYPVIFSMALKNLRDQSAKASALLVMAGIGGAFWPMLQAVVADRVNLLSSFWVPVVGYLFIIAYGTSGYKPVVIKENVLSGSGQTAENRSQ